MTAVALEFRDESCLTVLQWWFYTVLCKNGCQKCQNLYTASMFLENTCYVLL